jgi:hypothetical protein
MSNSYISDELVDTIDILDRLLAKEKWEFLRKTLKKYLICFDFLMNDQDDLYLSYWRKVEDALGIVMENELASVHIQWLHQHSVDFNIRTDARLGAFLRSSGCTGDFTLELSLQELSVLQSWKEEFWIDSLSQELTKIYRARGQELEAKYFQTLHVSARTINEPNEFLSFGHELLDAELLEVSVPDFMKSVKGLPRDSLQYRYNLAKKYFRNLPN